MFGSSWKKGWQLSCWIFPLIRLRVHIIILVHISRQSVYPKGGNTSTTNLTILQKHENNKRKVLHLSAGGGGNSLVIYAYCLSCLSLSSTVWSHQMHKKTFSGGHECVLQLFSSDMRKVWLKGVRQREKWNWDAASMNWCVSSKSTHANIKTGRQSWSEKVRSIHHNKLAIKTPKVIYTSARCVYVNPYCSIS